MNMTRVFKLENFIGRLEDLINYVGCPKEHIHFVVHYMRTDRHLDRNCYGKTIKLAGRDDTGICNLPITEFKKDCVVQKLNESINRDTFIKFDAFHISFQ